VLALHNVEEWLGNLPASAAANTSLPHVMFMADSAAL